MSDGQGYGYGYGHGAPPPQNPYAQPVPQNPYAQPVAPPHPYAAPQPYAASQPYAAQPPYPEAQFAPPSAQAAPLAQPAPPAPGAAFPGPAPRRGRLAVLLQFLLQWIYAPLWILGLVLLFAVLLLADYSGSGPSSDGWLKVNRTFLPPRRLRAELTGRPEDWERYLTPILRRRIEAAEAAHAAGGGEVQADLGREVSVGLAVRLYRGLGADGVVRLAERHGWQGSLSGTDAEQVRLVRRFPAPAGLNAPSPQDPPAAPGTPWGPQPTRPALLLPFVFLLQILYVPVYGLLTFWVSRPEPDYWERWGARWTVGPRAFRAEFTDSPAAWDRHIRRILARDTARKDGSNGPPTGPGGTRLRRIRLNRATYRGAGAHQALRIAAEQGWTLDPAYTPDPANSLRLCRHEQA
ncbi:hypothetical protein [Streptomyces sp. 1331.2]|uniref:hypothetical protein n=1 Tax=Streptomyces sp. 1331.2 TaxID=1938835 RepID=UPI000BC9E9EC|nr:hypothetical protein [Streptomyces sp. 1331.2]SOB83055.1 hypothetical protein SAMN06272789_3249 [Streptomyces sp. 1331.2]